MDRGWADLGQLHAVIHGRGRAGEVGPRTESDIRLDPTRLTKIRVVPTDRRPGSAISSAAAGSCAPTEKPVTRMASHSTAAVAIRTGPAAGPTAQRRG